ncbi:Sulfotransferase family protein [Nitratireductor indicus]|nr:Sulfotransferase family protein [Nitratireductor indicus]
MPDALSSPLHRDLFEMSVRFARAGEEIEGERFLAKATAPWDYRLFLAEKFAKQGAPAIIPNAFGSWFRSLAALKQAGVNEATIMIPRDQNFLATPNRTAVIVEEFKVIFLPIYKCGTSSWRALVHANCSEFSDRDASDSTSLNRTINPQDEQFGTYEKFTFVRQPMDRFGSFFRDKLLAEDGTPNHEHFIIPISVLMGQKISAHAAAEFIASIPPEYCDPHYKPQWLTIKHRKTIFPDHIFRLSDSHRLSEIGVPHKFPTKLSTASRKDAYKEDPTLQDAETVIRGYYPRDYRLWRDSEAKADVS